MADACGVTKIPFKLQTTAEKQVKQQCFDLNEQITQLLCRLQKL